MIIKDKDAAARLNSPMNLVNRLKNLSSSRKDAMGLFGVNRHKTEIPPIRESGRKELETIELFNPFQPKESSQVPATVPPISNLPEQSTTSLDNILENHESQIKLGLAHDNALSLLNNSIKQLAEKLDDVRADRLPSVIAAASRTVESIRKERNEQLKNNKDTEVHYHFYTPEQRKIETYEVIDVA